MARAALCDGLEDCGRASDAELCARLDPPASAATRAEEEETCSPDHFACYLGSFECLPSSVRCDCKFDCAFGEDEESCHSAACSPQRMWRCPGELKYINSSWLCDRTADCSSGADELPALCGGVTSGAIEEFGLFVDDSWGMAVCADHQFQCASGACVALDRVCDGRRDCDDGTDEGRNCSQST